MADSKPMKSLGYMNGWGDKTPELLAECRKKQKDGEKHDTFSQNRGLCLTQYGCRTCGYTYMVDSGD